MSGKPCQPDCPCLSLMPRDREHCCRFCDNRRRACCEENRKQHTLENPDGKTLCQIKVDGCLIPGADSKKCDYMIVIPETRTIFLIELKGSDIIEAVKQIDQTRRDIEPWTQGFKIFGRIVLKHAHTHLEVKNNALYRNLDKKLKFLQGDLKYSTNGSHIETLAP